MKYIECDVYQKNGNWNSRLGSIEGLDKVLIFSPDTKDEDIEKLPEEQRKIAFVAHRMYFSDRMVAMKYGCRTCMGLNVFAFNYDAEKEYEDIVGTRHPIELCA